MYALEHGEVAEVAFSTAKEWQGKGIAGIILNKLVEAARENGLLSLVAYTLNSKHYPMPEITVQRAWGA
jgi:GNAT superfamily N-acetyltransferase